MKIENLTVTELNLRIQAAEYDIEQLTRKRKTATCQIERNILDCQIRSRKNIIQRCEELKTRKKQAAPATPSLCLTLIS